ncbi:MAG: hypothetical protein R3253_14980, partial [Longimicrobiales bacterium]|nr:hypothetical protein [Longimicrobiales bacterium]
AWSAELTVATLIAPDASDEERSRMEDEVEAGLGVSVRASVRALPAASAAEAIRREASRHDLVVVGMSAVGASSLSEAVDHLEGIEGASLIVVRAHDAPTAMRGTPL